MTSPALDFSGRATLRRNHGHGPGQEKITWSNTKLNDSQVPKAAFNNSNISFVPTIGLPVNSRKILKKDSDLYKLSELCVNVSPLRKEKIHPTYQIPNENTNRDQLLNLVQNLKEEITTLKIGLRKSESSRANMKLRIANMQEKDHSNMLSNVLALDSTRTIKNKDGQKMGLLWNMTKECETLRVLNDYLEKREHSSRCPGDQSLVILSERQLEMVSFPMDEQIKSSLKVMNKSLHAQTNMIGHLIVSQEEIDVTAGFAGTEGNLIWFNTGGCALLLRLKIGKETQSIILEQGFGFCLGKREKLTRVCISSFCRTANIFDKDRKPLTDPKLYFLAVMREII